MKATEADYFKDELFPQHWLGAYQENILRAPYHFWRYSCTPKSQIDNFRAYVASQGESIGELPPILDVEDTYAPKLPWRLYEHLLECLQRIEDSFGVEPWIYTGAWYWDEWVKTTRLRTYKIIIANYKTILPGSKPYLPKLGGWTQDDWVAWQHSCHGKVAGFQDEVDLNVMKEAVFQQYSVPTPTPPAKIVKVLIPDGVEVIVEKI
jgi:lysozyme